MVSMVAAGAAAGLLVAALTLNMLLNSEAPRSGIIVVALAVIAVVVAALWFRGNRYWRGFGAGLALFWLAILLWLAAEGGDDSVSADPQTMEAIWNGAPLTLRPPRSSTRVTTVLDGRDTQARAALIAERIEDWKSIANS